MNPIENPSRSRAALVGLAAAATALGVGELVAGVVRTDSPIIAVGDGVIEATPPMISEAAITLIGGLNRPALVTGVLVAVALFGLLLGLLAVRRFVLGAAGVVALGTVGIAATVASAGLQSRWPMVLPGVAAAVAGVLALRYALPATQVPARDAGAAANPLRRGLLRAGGTLAVVAAATAVTGRWLQDRASAAVARAELVLPRAAQPLPAPPDGADFGIDGQSLFVTPNRDFYRIDTALRVPRVNPDEWTLRVFGMVDNEIELTYDDLLEREIVEADITLACVSNEIGGDLIGNARWRGVRLDDVLEQARPLPGATQLVGRSVDGWTAGFPVEEAMDGRDALIAFGMNGEPLPLQHGFPVRLVVPGLYGYVSATKWLAELELTTFEAFDHYWKRRNWAEQAPIKTQSRIDTPRGLQTLEPGLHLIAGVAWAQHRGISRVEVQVDEDEWAEADLADVTTDDTWRLWRLEWDATPGLHRIRVRATDGDGETQGEDRVDPIPDGAEGWHTITVTVSED
jgi:DMSO/TMAO reductase YedYZ molybdopterin-dependent catalytic subunit